MLTSIVINILFVGMLIGALINKMKPPTPKQEAQTASSILSNSHYTERAAYFHYLPKAKGATVMLGDSLTELGKWSEYFPNAHILNRGIGGDNTIGVLNRLGDIVAMKPSKVFLMIGVNDVTHSASSEDVLSRYTKIVDSLIHDLPDTKIIIQSIGPIAVGPSGKEDYLNSKINEINKGLAALSADRKLTFVDLHSLFTNSEGQIKAQYTTDKIHLKPEGYAVWVKAISPLIEN